MTTTAVILAGGFGSRLQSMVNKVPKPMAPVNNAPFLHYQLRYLKHFGIRKVVFSVGYLHEIIVQQYKNSFLDIEISYAIEKEPLGTGGGIRLALEKCEADSVLVLNGDSFFDFNLRTFYQLHINGRTTISLALRHVDDASRYGTIKTDERHKVISFLEKGSQKIAGNINAGVYLLDRNFFLENTPKTKNFSIEKDFFETGLNTFQINAYEFDGYFIDIGIPEDYQKAQNDFEGFKY